MQMTHPSDASPDADPLINACLRIRQSTLDWFKGYAASQERTASAQLRQMLEQLRADTEASA